MNEEYQRMSMDVDIVCVGFGPAMGGFLTTLSRALLNEDGTPRLESRIMPGMPLQISCYERSDDTGFGVSGVATRARGIKASLPDFDPSLVSMASDISDEKMIYLLDPLGASRRPRILKFSDAILKACKWLPWYRDYSFDLPWIPSFLRKDDGLVLSIGQFNQWVAGQVMSTGTVMVWPGTPVNEPLVEENRVTGVRLVDQGTDKQGNPGPGFMPGMDVKAALTVIGDGPVGPVGQKLDDHFGMPGGNHHTEWAVGAKMVIDLKDGAELEKGSIFHTFGFPEPEIFGFMYAHTTTTVSVGVFIPSWFRSPVRNSYRYLQHWMKHPRIWKYLEGGTLRSWGAKSLEESGKQGEPYLAGNGYARIGEGSGSTNVLAGAGVDEAWVTGCQLAEAVIELAEAGEEFTRENIERTYVKRRRESWVEKDLQVAKNSRNGFNNSFFKGMMGMALAGFSGGRFSVRGQAPAPDKLLPSLEDYYRGIIPPAEVKEIVESCHRSGELIYDRLMTRAGWPEIEYDGKLLVSQQDALLMGGKVQAPDGYADHVVFREPSLCKTCHNKICVEMCSGQAIANDPAGGVKFDNEKCIHCGACKWNCSRLTKDGKMNVNFKAGAGGLHSAEN